MHNAGRRRRLKMTGINLENKRENMKGMDSVLLLSRKYIQRSHYLFASMHLHITLKSCRRRMKKWGFSLIDWFCDVYIIINSLIMKRWLRKVGNYFIFYYKRKGLTQGGNRPEHNIKLREDEDRVQKGNLQFFFFLVRIQLLFWTLIKSFYYSWPFESLF